MAHKDAARRGAKACQIPGVEKASVRDHLGDGRHGEFRVARVPHARLGEAGAGELEIRHENVHVLHVIVHPFRPFVSGTVEQERDRVPFGSQGLGQRADVRPKMVGRDKIEIVHASMDQAAGNLDQVIDIDRHAMAAAGDLVVLTEKTSTGTAAEEDRARSASTRDGRLFAKMRLGRSDAANGGLPAASAPARDAIYGAVARAEAAAAIVFEGHE